MNITDRLKLELFVREQFASHGEDFYTELAKILEKLNNEYVEDIDTRGKPNTFSLRW
jgi:hypothetical protein